ncbi:uncharacterized protein LOC114279647 [Camellia sinensis]|uniref:uncharacterized protein LOC114279647 n=1 Tax=Camellia sinensis TaxID=4442 RepID=UPI00103648C6|nr:uncharacterized protein LOC114279647 [Camellia sinensis]
MATSNGGAMFIKAVNCMGETKVKYHIAKLISKVIDEVGPNNVIQVITNNAPVCSVAGSIIQGNYPKIFWTPCVVHTVNLALKNICVAKEIGVAAYAYDECHWITIVIDDIHALESAIVMLKRFKLIYHGLQTMVISEKWASYKEDDVGKAAVICDTDKPCLHLVYEMWDSMIERVKASIYKREGKSENEESSFYFVVHQILVERWTKSSTPLHCLAHSLNPRYYSGMWLHENPIRVPPHKDVEISGMRIKCFKRYFPDSDERRVANTENKMTPQRCEDLVFEHSNIRLLSRRSQPYTEGETKLWDIGGDAFDSLEGSGFLEITSLSLDEPEMEAILFNDEVDGSEL